MATKITSDEYGTTKDGKKITRYTLSNSKKVSVQVLDYGALIDAINVPDKNGKMADINLGYDNMPDWESNPFYFGALIGRVANRIAGGQFTLDGKTYDLHINNGPNCLHGGKEGFNKKVWKSSIKNGKVEMVYVSPDMEENFPGEVTLTLTYSLDEDSAFTIDYHATTTKATPVNFTCHAYFNMGGHDQGNINDHVITIPAETHLPKDDTNIPTGESQKVAGTEYDLRQPVRLGDRLPKVPGGTGFDTSFPLDNKGALVLAARVEHPPSGRFLECHTTEPSMHLYTGYFIGDSQGKAGVRYGQYGAFCLEAQHYPDSIHQPNFPDVVLRPGKPYTQKTVYKFGVM